MHRAHDYRRLVERWRAVCRRAGLHLRPFASASDHRLYAIQTPALSDGPGLYVSAGIHGDEPASCEGLVSWAEENVRRLRKWPLLLFPCLNPWGLINNTRLSEEHLDLNRSFHLDKLPLIAGWKKLLGAHQFQIALTLHEDYDGEGLYLYEVQRRGPGAGECLLEAAAPIMPVEPRARIDSFTAVAGIIRRRLRLKRFETIGYPEAVWLHLHHSLRTFTVETPSEFALERRAAAHRAVLDAALAMLQ